MKSLMVGDPSLSNLTKPSIRTRRGCSGLILSALKIFDSERVKKSIDVKLTPPAMMRIGTSSSYTKLESDW